MDIGLLGPLVVDGDCRPLGPRDRVVLAALAMRPGEVVARDRLADALWGEELPASWRKVVQSCVVRVRKVLGPATIETTAGGYRLALAGEDVDVCRFEHLAKRGRALAATGEPERAASSFARALALWRGPPFEDIDGWPPGRNEAARLEELRRTVEEEFLDSRLQAGEHREVATECEVRVAEEPLRERRWAILALAQYRCGRQADALRSLSRARRMLADTLGIDLGPELVALETALLRQDPDLLATPAPAGVADWCPYKGLAPYDVGDSESFFGRAAEVTACLERLESSPLLVVAGPSGCGKSSLVRAGVVPALQRRGRSVAVIVPGQDPDQALAGALAAAPDAPVLVVDQLEGLFTIDDRDAARAAAEFCGRLAAHATDRAPVIVAVRADHLAVLAAAPGFARLAEQGLHLVSPLAGDALREAIEGPATQAGLRVEHGLVDLLVRDTEGEPGALPLLSHALAETWRRRDGRVLSVEGYRATGGIRGAVARSADRLYESLPPDQRAIVRSVLANEAITVARAAEDEHIIADALVVSGLASWATSEPPRRTRELLTEGLAVARGSGRLYPLVLGLLFLGWIDVLEGRFDDAASRLDEGIILTQELKDARFEANGRAGRGLLDLYRGRYDDAQEQLRLGLALAFDNPLFEADVRRVLFRLKYARGELDAATAELDRGLGLLAVMLPWEWATCKALQAQVELARSHREEARQCAQDALSHARTTNHAPAVAAALGADGALARLDGEPDRAEDRFHEALEVSLRACLVPGACDALEALAGAVADQHRFDEAARLFGAAQSLRDTIGYARVPIHQAGHEADLALGCQALGTDAFAAAWDEGAALSLDEAVAYARRGRGQRKRPAHGWNSLTPTEQQIVELVAQGLTNPQIGARLFISKRTVQTHLTHVFTKLGLSTRAELAATATRRHAND